MSDDDKVMALLLAAVSATLAAVAVTVLFLVL